MKKWIIGLVALVVVAVVGYAVFGSGIMGVGASQATPQPTADIPPVTASGDVNAEAVVVPVQNASLSMPTGGIVAEVLVAEGDQVAAGDVLLRLDGGRQAAALSQAEAQLSKAQNALAQLKAGPRAQEVAAAQAAVEAAQAQLARIQAGAQPEEVAAAEAALAGARASLQKVGEGASEETIVAASADLANAEAAVRQAQARYDRIKGEPDAGARPEALALEQATNAYNAARARLEALQKGGTAADLAGARAQVQQAQAQLDALKAPARPAEIAAAEAEIRRAQAQLELLEAGARAEAVAAAEADVAAAQAGVQQAKVALSETELRAPFAGAVASLTPKAGEQVTPGTPVAVLADFSSWQIETDDLTEISVVRVHEGDPVKVAFDAIPDLELGGKVLRVKPIGEQKMGDMTYTVIVGLDKQDERLRWNMTATVLIGDK